MAGEEEKDGGVSKRSIIEQPAEPQLWSKVVYVPLNDNFVPVCGPATFGPILVNACVIDGGCTTNTLLPWPDDPDALQDFFHQSDLYDISVGCVGVVGCSLNIKVNVGNPQFFPVVLDGVPVCVFQELRFVITEEARKWLEPRGVRDLPPKDDSKIYRRNQDCALIGQQVLENLASLQIGPYGMLLINLHEYMANPSPPDFVKDSQIQLRRKKTSVHYNEFLKELLEPGATDPPFRPNGMNKRLFSKLQRTEI